MADTKITGLLTPQVTTNPATDVLPIVNIADTLMAASGSTRKITVNQLLGAGGTATLASATITGDLTVRTNKLAVTSTGVGVGTASPSVAADVVGSSAGATLEVLRLQNSGSGINTKTRLNFYAASTNYGAITGGFGASSPEFIFDINTSSGAFIWNNFGSEAMRLNSTGLGVGTSPTSKLTIGTAAYAAGTLSGTSSLYSTVAQGLCVLADGLNIATRAGADRFTLDTSGNVGIGVTPSAWTAGAKALQFGAYGSLAQSSSGNIELSFNSYNSGAGAYKYLQTDTASLYRASSVHSWFVAPSGTAGQTTTVTSGNSYTITAAGGTNYTTFGAANNNVGTTFTATSSGTGNGGGVTQNITFTQAMTLDASGNLLVAGTSAYIRAGGRTQIVGGSVVDINTVGNNVGIAFGGASSILPCDGSSTTTDGVANFGSASKRWNTIYASTGTINTSDQNEKQDIADLGDAEKRVAGKIKSLVKKYRFKDAVASKGENARIHVGWIAQDIENAFSSEGLDASKYGVFCSDTWEENGVQKTRIGLRYDEVLAFVVSAI